MDFEQIVSLLGNYAFPIVCCIYLIWSNGKEREAHKQEMDKVTDALNNNTVALASLKEVITGGYKNGK